jgi:hypothetical protein
MLFFSKRCFPKKSNAVAPEFTSLAPQALVIPGWVSAEMDRLQQAEKADKSTIEKLNTAVQARDVVIKGLEEHNTQVQNKNTQVQNENTYLCAAIDRLDLQANATMGVIQSTMQSTEKRAKTNKLIRSMKAPLKCHGCLKIKDAATNETKFLSLECTHCICSKCRKRQGNVDLVTCPKCDQDGTAQYFTLKGMVCVK